MSKKIYVFALLVILASFFFIAKPASAVPSFPAGFASEVVISNLTGPTTIAFAPDGRIFIGQKNGVVKVFENGAVLPTAFIDISAEVNQEKDRGLLGIAVHPQFPTVPYIYLLYTYDPPGVIEDGTGSRVSRLMRVSADPNNTNVALAGSEVIILGTNSTFANIGNPNHTYDFNHPSCAETGGFVQDCIAMDSSTHTIGSVVFGIDGSLFVSSGDGAQFTEVDPRALRALDIRSLNGKILRINPITGEGYPDNPFYNGDPYSNQSKVYSLGLRNPFRIAINPLNNEPFIGDVGWNLWEEINFGRGENFGWPCYEGQDGNINRQQGNYKNNNKTSATCAALYALGTVKAPIYSYPHDNEQTSVQAGTFYTGSVYPSTYLNTLFIADYDGDWIRYLTFDENYNATVNNFGTGVSPTGGIVQLLSGPDKNLYYVAYNGPTPNTSEVRRIRYVAGGNTPPTANASADITSGYAPLLVNLSGNGSYDPDADALTYEWDFGDGNTGTGQNTTHTYTNSGTFTATLTVIDPFNETSSDSVTITVGNLAPTAEITSPTGGTTYSIGDTISFTGTGTDNEDGSLTGASLKWDVLMHHNEHVHFDYIPNLTGTSGSFVVDDHGDSTWLELCLTVTDSGGLLDQDCIPLSPNIVEISLNTSPSNLILYYGGSEATAPFVAYSVANAVRDVSASLNQIPCWDFVSWSNGQPASHQIQVGTTNQSLTATYVNNCPVVSSITRSNSDPSGNATVNFTVTFSKPVTGVDTTDFSLNTTGLSGASVSAVSGSGSSYQVSVTTGSGNGTLQLNLIDDDSIKDAQNNPLGNSGAGNGDFTNGENYNIIKTAAKTAPHLSLPASNLKTNNTKPTFTWSKVNGSIGYEIVIAKDLAFNQIVITEYISGQTFTPSSDLTDGIYYWRVRGFNGRFSTSRRLVIDTTPPASPTITSPMNGANLTRTPIFRWTRPADAVTYQFQYTLSTDTNWDSAKIFTVRQNNLKPPAIARGTYMWRVRATDASGNVGTWSTIYTFTIQ